jgi:diadenosine tetraphosphatase ApaH/serine/threonine PP2A family protein phosphatase
LLYAIISDLHANLEALQRVLQKIEEVRADNIVCLGDVVGYNAKPNECIDLMRELGVPTVCGNHDAVASGLVDPYGFNPVALRAALWTRDALRPDNLQWLKELPDVIQFSDFLAVHGSPTDRDSYLFTWEEVIPYIEFIEERDQNLCFFGHTHYPGIFSADGMYTVDENSKFRLGQGKTFFINPGSVGQPRDGDPRAAFGLLDTDKREYELVRVEYNVQGTASEILDRGLPNFLAERLFVGR